MVAVGIQLSFVCVCVFFKSTGGNNLEDEVRVFKWSV